MKLEPVAAGPAGPFRRRGGGRRPGGADRGQAVDGLAAAAGRGRSRRPGPHLGAGLRRPGGAAFRGRRAVRRPARHRRGRRPRQGGPRPQAGAGPAGRRWACWCRGRLAELQGAPRVEKLTVQSEGLDFTRLRGYYPPLDRVSGAELRGPFTIEAQGQGSAEEQTRDGPARSDRRLRWWCPASCASRRARPLQPRAAGHRRQGAGAGRAPGAHAGQGRDDSGGHRAHPGHRAPAPAAPSRRTWTPRPSPCARWGRWWRPRRPPICPTCAWPSRPRPAGRWGGRRA